jgi:serine/threonine-protein kinase
MSGQMSDAKSTGKGTPKQNDKYLKNVTTEVANVVGQRDQNLDSSTLSAVSSDVLERYEGVDTSATQYNLKGSTTEVGGYPNLPSDIASVVMGGEFGLVATHMNPYLSTMSYDRTLETHTTQYEPSSDELTALGQETHPPVVPHVRWEIEKEMGQGGVGTVVKAFDKVMSRYSAIKTLNPNISDDAIMAQHFVQEARLTGALEHPNIVPVHDLGTDDKGHLFFTMKLISGTELTEAIYKEYDHKDSFERLFRLLDIFLKVSDALAYAHSHNILHCDIKTENIMLGDFGQVFLMDWGIAMKMNPSKMVERERGGLIGTPCFMSPEQASGVRRGLTPRSDIYGMGVILYQILAGAFPFDARDELAVLLEKICRGDFIAPSAASTRTWIPNEMERITLKAMALDPADRYSSVQELQSDIQRFMRNDIDFPKVVVQQGEMIVQQGDIGDKAYFILTGSCDVIYTDDSGNDKQVKVLRAGELFGETALLTNSERTASIIAREQTEMITIAQSIIDGEVESLKPWMAAFISTLAVRFKHVVKQYQKFLQTPDRRDLANIALTHLAVWGEVVDGHLKGPWTPLRNILVNQFYVAEEILVKELQSFPQIHIHITDDRVVINQPSELKNALADYVRGVRKDA